MFLTLFNPRPAYKSVNVVCKKYREAYGDRHIRRIRKRCRDPQDHKNNVICRVCRGIVRASSERETDRKKARRDRKRTRQQICGAERSENEVKYERHNGGQHEYTDRLRRAERAHLRLRALPFIRIAEPRHQRKDRHRRGHAEVGHHLPVIREGERYHAVHRTEHYHERLTRGISLRAEDESRHADERRGEREVFAPCENEKRRCDEKDGYRPKDNFRRRKIRYGFFYFCDHETSDLSVPRSFSRKKHPRTHLQRPNDVFTDAEASLPGGRLNIELRRTHRRPRTDTARNFRIFMMQSEAARTSKNEPRRISRYGKRCTDALKRTV